MTRIEELGKPKDCASFSSGVSAFKDDHQSLSAFKDVFLQLEQLYLQEIQFLYVPWIYLIVVLKGALFYTHSTDLWCCHVPLEMGLQADGFCGHT